MKAPLLPSDSTLMGKGRAGPRLCPHAFLVCGQYQLHLVVKHGSSELYHGIKSEGTHTHIYRKMNKRSIEGCRGKVALFSNSQVRVIGNSNFWFSSEGQGSRDQPLYHFWLLSWSNFRYLGRRCAAFDYQSKVFRLPQGRFLGSVTVCVSKRKL